MEVKADERQLRHRYKFILISVLLFIPLFIFKGIGLFDFWWWFTANILVLLTPILIFDKDFLPVIMTGFKKNAAAKITIGLTSAAVLYLVFYAGNFLSQRFFPFTQSGIVDIYNFRGSASVLRITLLMLFIIGPGEELIWRGFIQRALADRCGSFNGFLLTAGFYTLVHLFSGNLMLVLAASVCGLFWGWLYRWKGSMIVNGVSHIFWDIAVFIVFPFTG